MKKTTTLRSVLNIERRDPQQRRVALEVAGLDDAVGDRAEDGDRGEPAGRGAVDDHQAHQHRVDLVRDGEPERRSARRSRPPPGTTEPTMVSTAVTREHHPRDHRHAAADAADRGVHEPVDGAVVVGDREQVGDADEDDEQVAGEAGEDRRPRRCRARVPTMNAATMPSRPMLIGPQRADGEDRHQHENRYDFLGHPALP